MTSRLMELEVEGYEKVNRFQRTLEDHYNIYIYSFSAWGSL